MGRGSARVKGDGRGETGTAVMVASWATVSSAIGLGGFAVNCSRIRAARGTPALPSITFAVVNTLVKMMFSRGIQG